MRTHTWIASAVTGSVLLTGPLTTFAATAKAEPAADTITEEDILEVLDEAPAAQSIDGRGGGGYGILPAPYGGGVQVDASVTKEVTPDFVSINAYCSSGKKQSRETARATLEQIYQEIRTAVGTDGRVRKSGAVPVYPVYGPTGEDTGSYTADMNVLVRLTNVKAAQRISDFIDSKGCSVNWDVRLVDAQAFELSVLDDLSARLNKRKTVFEKLLGKKLNTVIGATLNTWVDGYGTYDPEANKVEATTTLSVSFDLGARTRLPASSSSTRRTPATTNAAPRG